MAGYCYKYKNKCITLETGCGNPNYCYSISTYTGKVKFGYNDVADAFYMFNKAQEYIDTHYEKVNGCPEDCPGFNKCKDTKGDN